MTACASDREGRSSGVGPAAGRIAGRHAGRDDAPAERSAGVLFNGERADTVSYQDIVVAVPPPSGAADPRDLAVVSETAIDLPKSPGSGPADAEEWTGCGFRARLQHPLRGRGVPVRQLAHDMNAEVAPILFSWPSREDSCIMFTTGERELLPHRSRDFCGLSRRIRA